MGRGWTESGRSASNAQVWRLVALHWRLQQQRRSSCPCLSHDRLFLNGNSKPTIQTVPLTFAWPCRSRCCIAVACRAENFVHDLVDCGANALLPLFRDPGRREWIPRRGALQQRRKFLLLVLLGFSLHLLHLPGRWSAQLLLLLLHLVRRSMLRCRGLHHLLHLLLR